MSDPELIVAGSLIEAALGDLSKFLDKITASSSDYFTDERLAALVSMIHVVRSKGIVADSDYYLRQAQKLKLIEGKKGEIWFRKVQSSGLPIVQAEVYAQEICEAATHRGVLAHLNKANRSIANPSTVKLEICRAAQEIEALQRELNGGDKDHALFRKSAFELEVPPPGHESELIKHRFLSRGGAMVIVGDTGLGKSSLVFQLASSLCLGRVVFGFEPTRRLRVLVIEAENDEGDVAEVRDGLIQEGYVTKEDFAEMGDAFRIVQINSSSGLGFLQCSLRYEIELHRPDLIVLDPALAYVGCNPSDPEKVGAFLRNGLNPLLSEFNCGCVIIHHSPKGSRNGPNDRTFQDPSAYEGMGSSEWGNWPRALAVLKPVDPGQGIYKLQVVKRGYKLRWRTSNGERQLERYLRHSPKDGVIAWTELPDDDAIAAAVIGNHTPADLLAHIPPDEPIRKTELEQKVKGRIPQKSVRAFLESLQASGQIHSCSMPNPSGRAFVGIARGPRPPEEEDDLFEREPGPRNATRRNHKNKGRR